MNKIHDQESSCTSNEAAARDKRRRLVQGLSAGVLTVSAKSALATGNCLSPSASASISLMHSRPDRDKWRCDGRTPGFWFNAATTHPLDWQYAGQTGDGEIFSVVFLSGFGNHRLRIVMGMTGNQDRWQLGAHLSAAYLNMRRGWVPEAVLNLNDLRAMWAGRNGTYSPTPGVSWGGEQIVSYLKTTMPL